MNKKYFHVYRNIKEQLLYTLDVVLYKLMQVLINMRKTI